MKHPMTPAARWDVILQLAHMGQEPMSRDACCSHVEVESRSGARCTLRLASVGCSPLSGSGSETSGLSLVTLRKRYRYAG